jgi:putative SOS response-associated peptidase YedK
VTPPSEGSRLDADHPANGVLIPRRYTLWRERQDGQPAFTMLTTAPGPDVAPYHDRQVAVLRPEDWVAWIYLTRPEMELLQPLPAGSLNAETVRASSD